MPANRITAVQFAGIFSCGFDIHSGNNLISLLEIIKAMACKISLACAALFDPK
jgi:hypothetical protein